MRILLVEDDESLGEGIRTALRRAAFSVDWLRDGASALAAMKDGGIDLVVLDLGLPHMDGMEVIRQARQAGADLPILVLSARERASDRTQGLDAGADDYLGKPFDTQELLARVRALLRRGAARSEAPASGLPGFTIDRDARTVVGAGGRVIDLTRTEFDLLVFLVDNRGKALSRDVILERVWGGDVVVDPRTVDNFVSSLKRKLGWVAGCGYAIRAVRGVGYRLELEDGGGGG